MAGLIEDCTDEFLSVIESQRLENKSVEARELFQRLSADVIFRSAFGLKSGLQQRTGSNKTAESLFQGSLGLLKMFRLSWRGYLFTCFPEFGPLWRVILWLTSRYNKTVTDTILDDVTPIVQYRRENREATRTDFLQLMLNSEADEGAPVNVNSLAAGYGTECGAEENDAKKVYRNQKLRGLTNAEIIANGLLFFVAGFETTGTAMSFLAYALAQHQEVQDRLRKEVLAVLERDGAFTYDNVFGMKYLDQVISESLRYQPSVVGFITRTGAHDYTHNNMTVPGGISILVPSYYMSHDATYWEEPEKFDPQRFAAENKSQIDPTVYQPFGQGPRNCIGMRFAQMEMKLTMAKTLAKYRFVLDDRHVKEKQLKIGSSFLFAYPENGIWLKIEEI
uniref:Putative cytochrome n=1 Tax=Amblyomma aureolatum TaxID=187763 RepID=A0A1E1X8Y0_9ACAR